MNILVFGATGRVGQSVLEYALANNHTVTAFVRNRAKLQISNEHLTIIEGDIYSPDALFGAMQTGFDAIINVIGGDVFKPSTIVTDSAKVIVEAMQKAGLTRYLGITGIAEMPANLFGKITARLIRISPIRFAVQDHDGAWKIVSGSNLNWTLAGCPYIRDGQHTTNYKVAPECFPGGFKTISPQDVADFLVKEATAQHYSKQVVGIWN